MAEVHITGINYIEYNTQDGLGFKYKPEVPKLKVVGTIMLAEDEDADDVEGVVFLTQKQLNQVLQKTIVGIPLSLSQKNK
jgi:hypothetical protein